MANQANEMPDEDEEMEDFSQVPTMDELTAGAIGEMLQERKKKAVTRAESSPPAQTGLSPPIPNWFLKASENI